MENKVQFNSKKMAVFLGLNLLMGCLYILIVRPGNMQDTSYWVYRIGALADEMSIHGVWGALPPHILSVTFDGYGYGAPLFYCDFFLWIPAMLVMLGVSEFTSFTILCAAIWCVRALVAGVSCNLVLKQFPQMENRYGLSVFFAFAYSCFPYMIEILLVRGAIGESLASIFFPLIAAALYRTVYGKDKDIKNTILLAVGFWGVVCSHTISIVLVACCVAIYTVSHWKIFWNDKWRLGEFCKAGMLAAGLSAFWLFPFLEQYAAHIIPDIGGGISENTLNISDWFIAEDHLRYRILWHPSTFGILLITWTFLYFVQKNARKNKKIGVMLALSWLLCVFMTSRTAVRLLEGLIGFMQFPWRLLSVVALLLSVAVVFFFSVLFKKRKLFITIYALYVICFFLSDSAWFRAATASDTSVSYDKNCADGLYLPQGGVLGMQGIRGEMVDANLNDLMFEWERLPKARIRIRYSNNTGNAVIQPPLFYYKGYEAYDMVNQSRLFVEKGDVGLIWVHLDPYPSGEVVISYVGTVIQKMSNIISLFTWIFLGGYLLWYRHRCRAESEEN